MTCHYQLSSRVRSLLILLFAIIALPMAAQNKISVNEEVYDDQETTCMAYPHKDRNNKDCALVIFHNIEPEGYTFDGNGAYIHAQKQTSKDTGEKTIFVYISDGAKNITIKHSEPGIGSLNYTFENGPLRQRQTYHVYLGQIVKASAVGTQYLNFRVTPVNAVLEVEEDGVNAPGVYTPWPLDRSGNASKLKRFGSYNYRVTAPDYHTAAGVASVYNATEPVTETVVLKPNFGYLTIPASDDMQSATIFVDGRQAGTSSLSKHVLSSGRHVVKVSKNLFKLYETTVNITDGQTTTLTPQLVPNFSRISISNPNSAAQLYIRVANNDRPLGTGTWSGPLEPGDYLIVSKLTGHKESVKQITVTRNGATQFSLPAPQAMYGSINVTSSPAGARIMLDGKDMGVTPKVINNVLAASHKLVLSRQGYNDYNISVAVEDGKMSTVKATLTNVCRVTVGGNGISYTVFANGKKLTPVGGAYTVSRGTRITVYAVGKYGYTDKTKEYLINTSRNITINLTRNLLHRNEFYMETGAVYSGYWGWGLSMGFNTGGFNMQFDIDVPFTGNSFDFYAVDKYYDYSGSFEVCEKADWAMAGRVGWTIRCGTRFRFTPQIGYKYLSTTETEIHSLLLAARMNLQLGYRFSIFASPEYQFKVQGDSPAMHLYGTAKNWSEGFALRFGASFNF